MRSCESVAIMITPNKSKSTNTQASRLWRAGQQIVRRFTSGFAPDLAVPISLRSAELRCGGVPGRGFIMGLSLFSPKGNILLRQMIVHTSSVPLAHLAILFSQVLSSQGNSETPFTWRQPPPLRLPLSKSSATPVGAGKVEEFVVICGSSPLQRWKRRGRMMLIQFPLWANVSHQTSPAPDNAAGRSLVKRKRPRSTLGTLLSARLGAMGCPPGKQMQKKQTHPDPRQDAIQRDSFIKRIGWVHPGERRTRHPIIV